MRTFLRSDKTCSVLCLVLTLYSWSASSHADGFVDVSIRKSGTNVVTSYGWDDRTNEASRVWFASVAPTATNSSLNVILTLGELTFPEAAEAVQRVVRPWRGPVFVNISAVTSNGAVVTLTAYLQTGNDVSVHLGEPCDRRSEETVAPPRDAPDSWQPLFPPSEGASAVRRIEKTPAKEREVVPSRSPSDVP
jgi:hypothetical protein